MSGFATLATCARFPKDWKHCPECQRKDKAKLLTACRACAGKGKIADPLDELSCGIGEGVCPRHGAGQLPSEPAGVVEH